LGLCKERIKASLSVSCKGHADGQFVTAYRRIASADGTAAFVTAKRMQRAQVNRAHMRACAVFMRYVVETKPIL